MTAPRRLRRIWTGLARYPAADEAHIDDWAVLARSTGRWWPGDSVCVAVERPSTIDAVPVKSGIRDEVRVTAVTWR